MLSEFVKSVVDLGVAGRMPRFIDTPEECPSHQLFLAHPDGSVEKILAEPEPRKHEHAGLASFLDYIKAYEAAHNASSRITVWYERDGVTAILDDTTRRDRACFDLDITPQLELLQGLTKDRRAFSQKALLNILRLDLDGCQGADAAITAVRLLKFAHTKDSGGEVQRGKESLGKAITSQLACADKVPEFMTLLVPVFTQVKGPSRPVRCAIEIDLEHESFHLIPLPGQVEAALQAAEEHLGAVLKQGLEGTDIGVYYGEP